MHKALLKENPRLVRAVGDGCFPLPEHSVTSRGESPLTDFKEARFRAIWVVPRKLSVPFLWEGWLFCFYRRVLLPASHIGRGGAARRRRGR